MCCLRTRSHHIFRPLGCHHCVCLPSSGLLFLVWCWCLRHHHRGAAAPRTTADAPTRASATSKHSQERGWEPRPAVETTGENIDASCHLQLDFFAPLSFICEERQKVMKSAPATACVLPACLDKTRMLPGLCPLLLPLS